MVIEHAELSIIPGQEAEFEAAFERGHKAIAQSPGYQWARLIRQIENPGTYLLLVGWESLEAHTVVFRGSDLFQQWRAAVGPYFASPPNVTHYNGELTPAEGA
jgi:Uncharacterized enzyme involved in biosynthesis of extracellular polysaccharides